MKDTVHYQDDSIDRRFVSAGVTLLKSFVTQGNALNLGIGYGVWDRHLAANCSGVTSVDFNPELIDRGRSLFPSIDFVKTDVFDFETSDKFDIVVCSHFLEHVAEPAVLLERVRNWLAPRGKLIVVVPNALSVHRLIGVTMGLLPSPYHLNEADLMLGHQRVYDQDSLSSVITTSGLTTLFRQSFTLKPVSNAMFSGLDRQYLEACLNPFPDWGLHGGQLAVVAGKR